MAAGDAGAAPAFAAIANELAIAISKKKKQRLESEPKLLQMLDEVDVSEAATTELNGIGRCPKTYLVHLALAAGLPTLAARLLTALVEREDPAELVRILSAPCGIPATMFKEEMTRYTAVVYALRSKSMECQLLVLATGQASVNALSEDDNHSMSALRFAQLRMLGKGADRVLRAGGRALGGERRRSKARIAPQPLPEMVAWKALGAAERCAAMRGFWEGELAETRRTQGWPELAVEDTEVGKAIAALQSQD